MDRNAWKGDSEEWSGSKIVGGPKVRRRNRSSLYDDVVAARAARGAGVRSSLGTLESLNNMKRGSVSSIAGLLPTSATRTIELVKKRSEADFGIVLTGDRPAIFSVITPRSAAFRAGLHVGDVLLEVNGRSVEGETHGEIAHTISKSKKTISFGVIDDEAYRLGMSLVGFSPPSSTSSPPGPLGRLESNSSPARSVSTTSSLASRSSLASHSDNESGKSPSSTGRAVSSSPTTSIQSGQSDLEKPPQPPVNAEKPTGSSSSLAASKEQLRALFAGLEDTRYDGSRRSFSHQNVTRNRMGSMSTASGVRSSLVKSKSFSQSEGSISIARPTGNSTGRSVRSNVAFPLTEDVIVGPPTETHRVTGASQMQHYDFKVQYYGDVVLSEAAGPGALTRMASKAARSIHDGEYVTPKSLIMQISSSGVCMVEKLGEQRRSSASDPVFIPRANLSATWCSREPPYFLTLLQRSNPWSVPPSSPLHKKVLEQQQKQSSSRGMSAANVNSGTASAASSSSSASGSENLLIVNAHVLQVDSRHSMPSPIPTIGAASGKSVVALNGHEGRVTDAKKFAGITTAAGSSGSLGFLSYQLEQGERVVALLATFFGGCEEKLSFVVDSNSESVPGGGDLQQQSADGIKSLPEASPSSETAPASKVDQSELSETTVKLVDPQGTLCLRGLETLTSRPSPQSQTDGSCNVLVGQASVDAVDHVHSAVVFDCVLPLEFNTNPSKVDGAEQEQQQEKPSNKQHVVTGDINVVRDLADEKFAALNLSSTSLADPVPKTGSGIGLQKASMDDIRPNGTSQSDGRVASWAINIMQLLTDNVGVQLFRKFLVEVIAQENLDFWLDVSAHQKLRSELDISQSAEAIVQKYLSPSSETQVNLDHSRMKEIEAALESPTTTMFDTAQADILKLMKSDSHPKFVRTPDFKEWMTTEVSNGPLPWDTPIETKAKKNAKQHFWQRSRKKASRGESTSVTVEDIPRERVGSNSKLSPAEPSVSNATSISRLDQMQSPLTSPYHGSHTLKVEGRGVSPSGSEASLISAVSNTSPAISKKEREKRSKSKGGLGILKKGKVQPDIRINLPPGSIMASDALERELASDEVLLRVTIIDTCGVSRRKKNSSIRDAIESSCIRASLDRDSVCVYECIGGMERPVDPLMQIGSLQSKNLRVLPLPTIRFLLPNGKMEIFTLRTPEMQLLEVVDHVLGNYGLSSHDAGMKDKNGKFVNQFTAAGKFTEQQITLDFDKALLEGRARRNSGDSTTLSIASVQSLSAEKSPGKRRSRSFRKQNPSPFTLRRRSRHGSPLSDSQNNGDSSRLSATSWGSDDKPIQTRAVATTGSMETLSDVRAAGDDDIAFIRRPPLSPTSPSSISSEKAALFDLVEKAQAESLVSQRATLHVPLQPSTNTTQQQLQPLQSSSPDPGYTPPLGQPDASFPFTNPTGTAPRAAVADMKGRRRTPEEQLIMHRRMSASPQTYRYRKTAVANLAAGSAVRHGSTASLSRLTKDKPEHHASTQSLTNASPSKSKRLMKSFSRSMSKLSLSYSDLRPASAQSDIPFNSSMLAGLLKDGDTPVEGDDLLVSSLSEDMLEGRRRAATMPSSVSPTITVTNDDYKANGSTAHRASVPSAVSSHFDASSPDEQRRDSDPTLTAFTTSMSNPSPSDSSGSSAPATANVLGSNRTSRTSMRSKLNSSSSSEEDIEESQRVRTGRRTLVHDV